jgi:acetylornithine deacetylase
MLSETEKRVLALIDKNKDGIVEFLQELISYKTITPPEEPDEQEDRSDFPKLAAHFSDYLEGMGFEIDTWEIDASKLEPFPGAGVKPERDLSGMPVVVGKIKSPGEGRSLILNGHYDVVPIGLRENWTREPFGGEIADGAVYGRGASDMKGGIAAMLKAVEYIQEAGIELNGDLIVELVPDEEASSMGTLACCLRGYRADAAVIPEPTSLFVVTAMRGNASGKVTVFGRAGHADMEQPHWKAGGAVNAISKAMKIVQAMEELTEDWRTRPDKQNDLVESDQIIPTLIKGGEWSVTYPEKVEITYNANFIAGSDSIVQEIEEKIMSVAAADPWLKENPPLIEAPPYLYGAEVSGEEPIVKAALEVAREFVPESSIVGMGSLTDAIHLVNYAKTPTVTLGPSPHTTAHMPDEYVDIDGLITATKALAVLIMRWCGPRSREKGARKSGNLR